MRLLALLLLVPALLAPSAALGASPRWRLVSFRAELKADWQTCAPTAICPSSSLIVDGHEQSLLSLNQATAASAHSWKGTVSGSLVFSEQLPQSQLLCQTSFDLAEGGTSIEAWGETRQGKFIFSPIIGLVSRPGEEIWLDRVVIPLNQTCPGGTAYRAGISLLPRRPLGQGLCRGQYFGCSRINIGRHRRLLLVASGHRRLTERRPDDDASAGVSIYHYRWSAELRRAR